MPDVQTDALQIPMKDRLSLRLALLFVGTFLAVLLLMLVSTIFGVMADSAQAESQSQIQPAVIVIDPKIQTDLAKAMAFDAVPAAAEVQNPFIDRAGIGVGASAIRTAATAQPSSAGTANSASRTTTSGTPPSRTTTMTQIGPLMSGNASDADGTIARYQNWLERQKRGEFVEPESQMLAVEDLLPVGFVSGGNVAEEVMLYSVSLCKTFSFPAGTSFYNGRLYTFNQQEVTFAVGNGIRSKSYARPEECKTEAQPRGTNSDDPRAENRVGG